METHESTKLVIRIKNIPTMTSQIIDKKGDQKRDRKRKLRRRTIKW